MRTDEPLIDGDALDVDLAFGISDRFYLTNFHPITVEPLDCPAMPLLAGYALSAVAIEYTDALTAYYAQILERMARHKKDLRLNRSYFDICLCFSQAGQIVETYSCYDNPQTLQLVTDLAGKQANHYDWFLIERAVAITIRTTEADLFMEVTSEKDGDMLEHYRFTRRPFQARLRQALARVATIEHTLTTHLHGQYFRFRADHQTIPVRNEDDGR